MRSHDSIMMNRADDSTFTPIMCSSMIMNLHAGGQPEFLDQTIAVEERIEIDPDVTVCGPRLARRNDAASLVSDLLFCSPQMLA